MSVTHRRLPAMKGLPRGRKKKSSDSANGHVAVSLCFNIHRNPAMTAPTTAYNMPFAMETKPILNHTATVPLVNLTLPNTLCRKSHIAGEAKIIRFVMMLGALETMQTAAKMAIKNPLRAKRKMKSKSLSKVITQIIRHKEDTWECLCIGFAFPLR